MEFLWFKCFFMFSFYTVFYQRKTYCKDWIHLLFFFLFFFLFLQSSVQRETYCHIKRTGYIFFLSFIFHLFLLLHFLLLFLFLFIYNIFVGKEVHDTEGRVITAEFENYFLVTSYVPNSGMKLDRYKNCSYLI
jgi:membrane-associated HD superfamily phosphohydrolase